MPTALRYDVNLSILFTELPLLERPAAAAAAGFDAVELWWPFSHVQIADPPGRGQPGTGEVEWDAVLARLEASGYRGHVGLEYKPVGPSAESFEWLPRHLRATATVEESV